MSLRLEPNPITPEQIRRNWQVLAKAIEAKALGTVPPFAQSDVTGLSAALAARLEDAPSDDKQYARTNGAWVEVVASGGGTIIVPDAPSDLTATMAGGSSIDLAWTSHSDLSESGFRIERSDDGSTGWTVVHTTAAGVVTWMNSGMTPVTEYFYRVRAVGTDGNSAATNTASATTDVATGASSFDTPPTTAARNNYNGSLGFAFDVAVSTTISAVGRLYVAGNSQDHGISIWTVPGGVQLATAIVLASAMSDANGFKWVDLTTPLILSAGRYAIAVNETVSGDMWTDGWVVGSAVNSRFSEIHNAVSNGTDSYPSIQTLAGSMYDTPAMWFE